MTRPVLLGVAHGSRDPAAQEAVGALIGRVALLAPELDVRVAFVQHAEPSLASALAVAGPDVVVVPLLLSSGYHLAVDISGAATAAGARLAAALGPHRCLTTALADHLAAAGAPAGIPVVLAAAGSSDPKAAADVELQAALLADRRGTEVIAAYATAATPTVDEAMAALRASPRPALRASPRPGLRGNPRPEPGGNPGPALRGPAGEPVAVASYLLSPGKFHDRLRHSAATWVSAPLGGHPAVAALVLDRYRAAASRSARPRDRLPRRPMDRSRG